MIGSILGSAGYLMMASGGEKPSLSVVLGNLWFLLTTIPFAKKKAKSHFDQALQLTESCDAPGIKAQSHLALGRLALLSKETVSARDHYSMAREAAQPLGWPSLLKEIETELSQTESGN